MNIIGAMKIAMGAGLIAASGLAAATPAEAQRYDRDGYGRGDDRGYARGHDGRDDRRRDRRDDRRWDRGDRRDGWHRGQARWDRGQGWGRGNGYGRSRVVCRWERTHRGRVRNCFRVYR